MASHFYSPVTNHDKENESQARLLLLQNVLFLGVVLCLSWNVFAVATAWIASLVATKVFILAIICLVVGVPGAYMSWYRLLNRALRSEDGKDYDWVFVIYMLYFTFWYFSVIVPIVSRVGQNTLVGTLDLIGFFFFLVEWVLSVCVFSHVWLHYQNIMMALGENKNVEAMRDQSQRQLWFVILPFTGFCVCLVVLMGVYSW